MSSWKRWLVRLFDRAIRCNPAAATVAASSDFHPDIEMRDDGSGRDASGSTKTYFFFPPGISLPTCSISGAGMILLASSGLNSPSSECLIYTALMASSDMNPIEHLWPQFLYFGKGAVDVKKNLMTAHQDPGGKEGPSSDKKNDGQRSEQHTYITMLSLIHSFIHIFTTPRLFFFSHYMHDWRWWRTSHFLKFIWKNKKQNNTSSNKSAICIH